MDKNIDESWKENAQEEKDELKQDNFILPQPDFNFFITTLGLQAGIFLGEIPNPATNKKEENLNQAKFIIDTMGMLKEKTKGNLTAEEEKMLENVLYELRVKYVAKTGKEKP